MATVETIIEDARGYVATGSAIAATELANAYSTIEERLKAMGHYVSVYDSSGIYTGRMWVEGITATPAILPTPPTVFGRWETDSDGNTTNVPLAIPTTPERTLDLPDPPPGEPPTYQDIDDIPDLSKFAPTNGAIAPGALNIPDHPTVTAVFNASTPAIIYDFDFPTAPTVLTNPVFNRPTITERTAPAVPGVVIPTLSVAAPVNDIDDLPDIAAVFTIANSDNRAAVVAMVDSYVDVMLVKYNPQYHTQMAAIETQLTAYLAGGTGFSPTVENAIYAKSAGVNAAEHRRTADSAWQESASRGFTMPGGSILSGLQRSRQSYSDKQAALSGERLVKAYEVEQQNLQFAVTASTGLRSTMVQATLGYMQNLISINGQALEFAKATVSNIIEAYNAAVRLFTVELDVYKAEVAVYEMHIRGAMATIELYRAEIAGLEAMTNVDRARIDLFKTEIETLNVYASVYRSQIDVVLSRANLEKTKVDMFGSQVSIFSAQVQADNAKWNGFKAQVDGELAKVEVYSKEIAAYSAEVDAFKAKLDGEVGQRQAQASVNDSRAKQYQAEVSAYNAGVSAESAKTQAQIDSDRQVFGAFGAEVNLAIAQTRNQMEVYQTKARFAQENVSNELEAGKADAAFKQGYAKMLVDVQQIAASLWNTQSSAALAGMNTLTAKNLAE